MRYIPVLLSLVLLAACGGEPVTPVTDPARPNILLIVADDLGYADLGYFGSEIPTPNLDMLAANSLVLTEFYAAMACSPTRSMLFSGTDSHLAGLGVMNPPTRPDQQGQPGYESYLNFRVASLADLLTDAGYNTYMTGKWHLGMTEDTSPAARGFKRSFALLEGGAAHLGGLSMRGPWTLAPYRDGFEEVTVAEDFYSTRDYTRRMRDYIEADRDDGRPFFAYLAYTAPHWPLQAPDESIDRFAGWYDEGYEALARARHARLEALGRLPEGAEAMPSSYFDPPWDSLSDEERRIEARKMEIYAAMVSDMDQYVGEILDYLKSIGEFDNTLIMFMADNGPEYGRRDLEGAFGEWATSCCDNSYDNMGRINSYVAYGPNWASASATPYYRHKGTGYEGGIRVPAFIHYPVMVADGVSSPAFTTVMDLMPTFLALAGTEHPGTSYRGQAVLPPKGNSLIPLLTSRATAVHAPDTYVGWELNGHRSVRQGDWKIVWDATLGLQAQWELYNLAEDPAEQHNLAAGNPEKLSEMMRLWDRYEAENGVIY